MCIDVHGSRMRNVSKLEMTQMPTRGWTHCDVTPRHSLNSERKKPLINTKTQMNLTGLRMPQRASCVIPYGVLEQENYFMGIKIRIRVAYGVWGVGWRTFWSDRYFLSKVSQPGT